VKQSTKRSIGDAFPVLLSLIDGSAKGAPGYLPPGYLPPDYLPATMLKIILLQYPR
jgi:hypothetical protein